MPTLKESRNIFYLFEKQPELPIDKLELLYQTNDYVLAERVKEDVEQVSPQTEVVLHEIQIEDPWDFEEVYTTLLDFAVCYPFDIENEEYLVHITTGTHVAQISCPIRSGLG